MFDACPAVNTICKKGYPGDWGIPLTFCYTRQGRRILQRSLSMNKKAHVLIYLPICACLFIISIDPSATGRGKIPSAVNDLLHALNKSI